MLVTEAKLNSSVVGAAGEHYVLCQLMRRGWIAALATEMSPNVDILVSSAEGDTPRSLQVKTAQEVSNRKGWHMKPKHETLSIDDLFYVFVNIGNEPSEPIVSYVLPSRVVAGCIRECHQVWLDTPGRGGKPHKEHNMRMLFPDYSHIKPITDQGKAIITKYQEGWLDQYRENWGIIGCIS